MFTPKYLCLLTVVAGMSQAAAQPKEPFWLGADISATTSMEAKNDTLYNVRGEASENTKLMKEIGFNAVRLRVWVNPKGGWSSKEDVLVMAKRAKMNGMAIMINFHYSDWWADPGKQNIPEQWKNYDYEAMKQAVAKHTEETLQLLRSDSIDVKWVQVGNETSDGFLWEMGRASANMAQYAGLTTAGYDAVKRVYPQAIVIVHLDNGFDSNLYNYIFDGLQKHGGKWDMIGMSLYPYWAMKFEKEPTAEKTLTDCIANIKAVSAKYSCDVMIVETGVESAKPKEGKAFMEALIDAAITQTNSRCKGVFYWAPECSYGYPLGAFQNNRPTIILDAFTEAAKRLKQF